MRRTALCAVLLSCVTAVGMLGGCGGAAAGTGAQAPAQEEAPQEETASPEQEETAGAEQEEPGKAPETEVEQNVSASGQYKGQDGSSGEPAANTAETTGDETQSGQEGGMSVGTAGNDSGIVIEDAAYVMIYNPNIYDQNNSLKNYISSLNTGDLSKQIVVTMNRGDGLEEPEYEYPMLLSQEEISKGYVVSKSESLMQRADGLDPVHSEGETYDFFCFSTDMSSRIQKTFECTYEGEKCYIWVLDGCISDENAQMLGEEFDNKIYEMDTEAFGPARFMQNGGKLNILFYPMAPGLGGFFCAADLVSEEDLEEIPERERYGYNIGHAIINVNSDMMEADPDFVKSTLAHEFQHLIVGSDYYASENTPYMRSWLNEAMSAYAEDYVYPGIKVRNGYNYALYASNNFRTGQSLYNFETANDVNIGAYGAVFLFSKYLNEHSDNNVYQKLHEYWRASDSADLTEAEALFNSVTDEFREEIDGKYTYPDLVEQRFDSDEEEWMSKLTMDYFIETLDLNFSQLAERGAFIRWLMLYKEINRQRIQGGGRIVVATENGSYAVPADADKGLVYIALDKEFKMTSDPIVVD